MKYQNIRKEELKNKVGQDFFADFDTSEIIGNIDFCVSWRAIAKKNDKQLATQAFEQQTLLWAEAKRGTYDVMTLMTQLVLKIGKARTFDKRLPPAFLGAFDSQKIGFVPYNAIIDVFSMNDFNWNVTPSNHETREFTIVKERIEKSLHQNHYVFDFEKDVSELQFFIKNNIAKATESGKILIDKNNFVPIYLRWLDQVKPHIDFNWIDGRKQNISDNEFYLADLFACEKGTSAVDDDVLLSDNLFVVFINDEYEIATKYLKSHFNAPIKIKNKNAYEQFWKKYKRPPLAEFQQYILMRKDLLVPQDIRERKGAFFTPKKWVELSQQYIADVLGEDWQEEYYLWDCAAGTGNLLAGLTNKYNIWASTLDQSDVNAMHERIENGAILLKHHVFQFDFLNDDFTKLPQGLQDIINDDEKRKKLVVYINPPYAEATSAKTVTGTSENRNGVTTDIKLNEYFKPQIGNAGNEIFALFMARIYDKMQNCHLAQFSTLKFVQGSNFSKFKEFFLAEFMKGFIVPANTFDNVNGSFPIGFTIWNTNIKEKINTISCDTYDKDGIFLKNKFFYGEIKQSINNWLINFYYKNQLPHIATLSTRGNDFQNQKFIYLATSLDNKVHDTKVKISVDNLIPIVIYFSVRHNIAASWENDRDQFSHPNNEWQTDLQFQNDCLTFALFHSQNKISSSSLLGMSGEAINHWIPFTEQEVNAREKFKSNFMTQFIKGKIMQEQTADLFGSQTPFPLERFGERIFSEKATNVFNDGLELWKYYHETINNSHFSGDRGLVNASLYDIREYFQGRNDKGKMNIKSQDQTYMTLIKSLRESLKILAKKIEPKVYEYEFLKD